MVLLLIIPFTDEDLRAQRGGFVRELNILTKLQREPNLFGFTLQLPSHYTVNISFCILSS